MVAALLPVLLLGAQVPEDSPGRRILLEVTRAVLENSRRPEKAAAKSNPDRKEHPTAPRIKLQGDDLADHLIRNALDAARRELDRGTEPAAAVRGLLLALGVSLDPSGLLKRNPAARIWTGPLENEEEGRARAEALGSPTLRGRRDALQHFAVSAALAGILGGEAARVIGIDKEFSDAAAKDQGKGSGFSFCDLASDEAGIRFASLLLGGGEAKADLIPRLDRLSASFRSAEFVPDLRRIESARDECLGLRDFTARFGSIEDPRFLGKLRSIQEEVGSCPGFKG